MIHFDPPVFIQSLDDVPAGSIVRWGENARRVGFCVVSSADPHSRKTVVIYNAEARRFQWEHADSPTVVSYGSEIIVRADVGSFHPALTANLDGTLYTLEGTPYLIVAAGNNMRFLNLATGQLESKQSWPMMGGYGSWIAGVSGRDNHLIKLLSVSQEASTIEEDSIDPE